MICLSFSFVSSVFDIRVSKTAKHEVCSKGLKSPLSMEQPRLIMMAVQDI